MEPFGFSRDLHFFRMGSVKGGLTEITRRRPAAGTLQTALNWPGIFFSIFILVYRVAFRSDALMPQVILYNFSINSALVPQCLRALVPSISL
jgi:hypothetical protein